MWLVVLPLVCGFLFGASKPAWAAKLPVAAVTNLSLYLLLLVMGARLGTDPQVVAELGSLGGKALFLAGATVLGSTFILALLSPLLPRASSGKTPAQIQSGQGPGGFWLSLLLLGAVLLGFCLGRLLLVGALTWLNQAAVWVLGLLLLGVGLDLGAAGKVFAELRQLGPAVIFIPIAIVLGSVLGGILTALLWHSPWQEGAAVASGFGWYSLSSVLIAQAHSPLLGALAFLANVLRELLAIILTPLVARWLGAVPAIAPGGATAMDVLLPVISRAAGREYAPLAFFSGAMLSLAVPLFVNLFLGL